MRIVGTVAIAASLLAAAAFGQAPAPAPPAAARGGGGGGFANSFPQHIQAPADVIARGKAIYEVQCAQCHGDDARGGNAGPNLIRDSVLLDDKNGELVGEVLNTGRPAQGMPKFAFSQTQIVEIAGFLHSFRVAGYDTTRNRPATIVVGDAKAGEAYFKQKCSSCHSSTGDLKGIGARLADPRSLQQRWIMPTGGGRGGAQAAPTTVTVTLANGQKVEGRLNRIDDFTVTLIDTDGAQRTIRRDSPTRPRVEVHDPIQGHRDLLRVYTDKNIHDVTAYLVTLK
jgi:mono/diheme cytochrome c family protein